MFPVGNLFLQQLKTICLCETTRAVRRSAKTIINASKVDPGIRKRAALLDENLDVDTLEDLESDFSNVGLSHKEYAREIEVQNELRPYQIVKQKYFKEKYPNFLTWNDKEQIRFLHKTNPEEWTIEKLSEGFPALPEVIKKISQATWTKKNVARINSHDTKVRENWQQFKEGKLNLPPRLVVHLNKFTNRSFNFSKFEIPEQFKTEKPPLKQFEGEFSEIITSYERLKNKNENRPDINVTKKKLEPPPAQDTYLLSKVNKNEEVTFSQLQKQIEVKADSGKMLHEDDKIILSQTKEDEAYAVEDTISSKIIDLAPVKFKTSQQVAVVKEKRDYTHLQYPERIVIPKDKLKPGYTYKLNDCYYDSYGFFLYRVPGMDK